MASELRRSLDFLREAEDRETREAVPFRFGTARFDAELPHVYDLNLLRVEHGEPTAEELAAEAERLQAARGLGHRRVQVPAELDDRLGGRFRELGWEGEALVVMALHRDSERPVDVSAAQEVERDERLVGAWRSGMEGDGLGDEVKEELIAHKELIAESTPTRYFAAFADGVPASFCELYTLGSTAQVEAVMTVPAHRGKGLASAVVLRAAAAARESGADLVFLCAARDDWPRQLYDRLGFDLIGAGHARYLRRVEA